MLFPGREHTYELLYIRGAFVDSSMNSPTRSARPVGRQPSLPFPTDG